MTRCHCDGLKVDSVYTQPISKKIDLKKIGAVWMKEFMRLSAQPFLYSRGVDLLYFVYSK